MVEIVVAQVGAEEFDVLVHTDGTATRHRMSLPRHARAGLGLHGVPPTVVVEETVRFLLERQPAGTLPAEGALPVLAGAYPEYPEEIRSRVG